MFNAGMTGYNVARGLVGALKPRAPRAGLIEELLDARDYAACEGRLRGLGLLDEIECGGGAGELERCLRWGCASFAGRIRNFLGGPAGRLLEAYCLHYHLYNVKVLFRASLVGGVADALGRLYPFSAGYAAGRLARVKSPEDVAAFFDKAPLAGFVRAAYEVSRAHGGDVSVFEVALDRDYLNQVWRAAERVRGPAGRRVRQTVLLPWLGTTAVLWVLWLDRYRGMPLEGLAGLLALPEKIISAELIAVLVEKREAAGIAEAVGNRLLRGFLAQEGLPRDLVALHRLSRRFLWRTIKAGRLDVTFDISTLLKTLMRWELVVEDAIAVANGKEMDLATDEIRGLLATLEG